MLKTVTYDDAVHKFVPMEPDEAMMHAAEDVQAPRPYGAVYRAMTAAAPEFTSLPNPDLEIVGQTLQYAAENLDADDTFIDAYAAFKRMKGDV